MSRNPDELRTRRALRALDQAVQDYPAAFHPDRLPTSPAALAVALGEKRVGRPPAEDPKLSIGIRFPISMVEAIDRARGDRTRQEVVREAVEKWLRAERRKGRP